MRGLALKELGGTCAILVGACYIVIGINYLVLPPEQAATADPAQFLLSFASRPTQISLQYLLFGAIGLLGLAVVPAVCDRVRPASEGWVRWGGNLGVLGFAVTALNFFRIYGIQRGRAALFGLAEPAVRQIMASTDDLVSLDPQGWLGFGAVGVWVLIMSWLALRGGFWPKALGGLGIAVGILYFLVVAAFLFESETLLALAAGLGAAVAGPIWYIWVGLRLRRESAQGG